MCLERQHMQILTKFLWLERPVALGDQIDDWRSSFGRAGEFLPRSNPRGPHGQKFPIDTGRTRAAEQAWHTLQKVHAEFDQHLREHSCLA